jgi:PTH1 family peptidyl-tRNA hydrolase
MKLIFAQGNPESKYDGTRHNIGFAVIDRFAKSYKFKWSSKTKFNAVVAETTINGEKILLAKPTTYYNETGQSARKLVDFYNLDPARDVLVIHDELALPLGIVRTRKRGSDAGNNGIKSLNSHIGEEYYRIRIGIANELRDTIGDVDFVLSKFTQEESDRIEGILVQTTKQIIEFIDGSLDSHSLSV